VQELERLQPEAAVYKLVGPVLVKQDLVEARSNVGKRLDFIRGERCGVARRCAPTSADKRLAASDWQRR
jgi:hypothetical protein